MNEIRNMVIEWDSSRSSLRRGYVVELFEEHNIFDAFKLKHWSHGNTPAGEAKRRRYLRIKQRYKAFLAGGAEPGAEDEMEEAEIDQQFAAEADLRDFLAKNPVLSPISVSTKLTDDGASNFLLIAATSIFWRWTATSNLSSLN